MVASIAWLVGCAPGGAADVDPADETESSFAAAFVNDADFDVAPIDTGNVADRCFAAAPWGPKSWGVEGSTFSDPDDHALDGSRFLSFGHEGYLYGRETSGRWGFVRYVQGDVWGGTHCGSIGWHRGEPVPVAGRSPVLALDVYRDTTRTFSYWQSWAMFAFNVWFSSPDLPEAGGDKNGRKPLVMDLIVHHECTGIGCGYRHWEDEAAYHYQTVVGQAALGQWSSVHVPLRQHIDAAFAVFGLPAEAEERMAIHQVEFLIELRNAEGAATIDDFELLP